MTGSVIAGFLVRLGFTVDQDEYKKFDGAVEKVGRSMASLTKKGIAFGTALTTAVAKSTIEVNKLYNIANRTGSSISGLKALGTAMKTVGGSAEEIQSAMAQLSDNIKYLNYEPVINSLGVSLRDAKGNARDMTDVMLDLREVLSKMPQEQARVTAEMLGLGGAFETIMKKEFPQEVQRSRDLLSGMTAILDANHESTRTFANEFGRLWDIVSTGAQTASSELVEILGLDEKLAELNNKLAKGILDFINWQSEIIKGSSSIWEWMAKTFDPVATFASDTRKNALSGEVQEVIEANAPDRIGDTLQAEAPSNQSDAVRRAIEMGADPSYFAQPIGARMGDTITNTTNNTTHNGGARNVTVNQTITISGVNDPQRIKREISNASVVYNNIQTVS